MTDALYRFYRSLHARGLDQTKLAAMAGTGRSHLSEVLNNKPGHGHLTRRRLFPHLKPAEVELLGWGKEYRRWRLVELIKKNAANTAPTPAVARSTENFVPQPTHA